MTHETTIDCRSYCVNIEGTRQRWDRPCITTEEIIELGGWDPALGVQEVNLRTNETRTLQPGEVVHLRPGLGFCKKIKWRRGRAGRSR